MSHQTHDRSYRGRVFTGQMTQPTVSKHWRKVGFKDQSHQIHPTVSTIIQQLCSTKQKHTKYTQINTNKSTHREMGPVWQNPIQRTISIAAHLSVLMTVHSFSTQYNLVSHLVRLHHCWRSAMSHSPKLDVPVQQPMDLAD